MYQCKSIVLMRGLIISFILMQREIIVICNTLCYIDEIILQHYIFIHVSYKKIRNWYFEANYSKNKLDNIENVSALEQFPVKG